MDYVRGLIIFGCILASVTAYTPFKPCMKGDKFEVSPSELRIEGCRKSPCIFYKGTKMTAEWDFTANKFSRILKPAIMASAYGQSVSLPSPQKNACDSLYNSNCPVKIGQNVTYKMKMPIRRYFPEVSAAVEIRFLNEFNQTIVCFEVDGAIAKMPSVRTPKISSSIITTEASYDNEIL